MNKLWLSNGFFLHSTLHFKQRNCVANSGLFARDFVEVAIFMFLSVKLVASVIHVLLTLQVIRRGNKQ